MSERWTPVYDRLFRPDHELAGEPVCRRFAWADLCHMASYQPGNRIVNGVLVPLDRAELVASLRYLADRWKWGKGKTSRFMDLLSHENVDKIRPVRETPVGTVYLIVNYGTYRDGLDANGTANGTPTNPTTGQARDRRGTGAGQSIEGVEGDIRRYRVGARTDALALWLGDYGTFLDDYRLTRDVGLCDTLHQHYGPPGMRANAWKRPDGTSVPPADRPRVFAVALSGYVSEPGRVRFVGNEFAGALRATIRAEVEQPVREPTEMPLTGEAHAEYLRIRRDLEAEGMDPEQAAEQAMRQARGAAA